MFRYLTLAGVITAAIGIGDAKAQVRQAYAAAGGQQVFQTVCQSCHMPDAKGAVGAGAYPALAGNAKLRTPLYPVVVMLRGQKAMPPFADLTDEQIADVTNYIRKNFGNAFPGDVTPDQVKELRTRAVQSGSSRAG